MEGPFPFSCQVRNVRHAATLQVRGSGLWRMSVVWRIGSATGRARVREEELKGPPAGRTTSAHQARLVPPPRAACGRVAVRQAALKAGAAPSPPGPLPPLPPLPCRSERVPEVAATVAVADRSYLVVDPRAAPVQGADFCVTTSSASRTTPDLPLCDDAGVHGCVIGDAGVHHEVTQVTRDDAAEAVLRHLYYPSSGAVSGA